MLPGVPWMKWALGEPRPGLGCWIGLASVPKPLAHHTLGTPACRERSLRSPQSLRSELELPDTLEASVCVQILSLSKATGVSPLALPAETCGVLRQSVANIDSTSVVPRCMGSALVLAL